MGTEPSVRVLRVLLGAAVAVSVVHYVDNTLRWDDFVAADPADRSLGFISRWTIPVAWVAFTACAVMAYRRFQEQRWAEAAAWLGAYSGSGLVGLGHYLDLSPSDLAPFQNAHVMIDIALGVSILAYAVRLSLRAPYLEPRAEDEDQA